MGTHVITIAREYGSGGRRIGQMLSRELEYHFYDLELMQLASIDSGISESLFAQADERTKGFSLFRGKREPIEAFDPVAPDQGRFLSDENLFKYQARVIQKLAQTEDCIIVGRCADFILQEQPNVLKLFVHAPMKERIATVREVDSLSAGDAEKLIRETDKRRAEYYRRFTGKDWEDARNYDLCLNTGRMSWRQCMDLVEACMAIRFDDFEMPVDDQADDE